MKKIFWCLQQLNNIGGTEVVTLQIIRMLHNDYEIHLVPFDNVSKDKIIYDIPSNVIIEDISFPKDVIQFDRNLKLYFQNRQFLKCLNLVFRYCNTYLIKRFSIRKKLESISSKEDIFVFPSNELMCFAPKKRYKIQHFHFNSKLYFNIVSSSLRLISKKPDHIVFLTSSTKQAVDKKNLLKSSVIPNPSRYSRKENYEFHHNTLITACRLEAQKNPMMLVKIAKALKDMNFNYIFNIYGSGTYKKQMEEYIKEHDLTNVHIISGITDLEPCYLNSDLYIITSLFEGFTLSVIEANSFSIPTIWKEMGDPTSSIITNGVNGYIIDSNNPKVFALKIIEVLSNQEELRKLKESTFNIASRYEESNIEGMWKTFFKERFSELEGKE